MSKHLLGFAIGKCNIEQISATSPPDYRYGFNSNSELKSFAQAVIEDYKASLVPVAYMYQHDETGRTTFREPENRMLERRWFEIPLYALGETK